MINAAVVGLGWWGGKVVRDLSGSDDVQVVTGVDISADARAAARPFVADVHDSFDEVLRDDSVDAVILCTPHKFHVEQIIAAAAHGKHVFCEKPLSGSGEDARRAVAAVKDAGLQLGIGHERRFEPAVADMRRAIADGELGVPLIFEGNFSQDKFLDLPAENWRLSAVEAPVGPLSATGIHLVDLAISILGRPTEVWARLSTQATTFANGDTLAITLAFEKGQTALITAVLTTPFVGRVTVLGSEGWVEIRDRTHPEAPQGWDVTRQLRGRPATSQFYPPHASVRENIETFAKAVAGKAPYPVPLDEMVANACTFEAITRSAHTGAVETVR
ncbi:Gfo/Idh/MocA family oxidoreductase [Mycolicibacterium smegmatis]|uniref:Gfo/Idh/MocA family protein n=1 Tax=Mycolicibacterium smegmatis TaxID=1772 RepID=UPI00071AF169|nr:Gfo/Idh/MocA family oxidoreductase [Mycolicibacterium smegmatis]MCP2628269.1 Gfo/Idh/MocA family oxidoreductase [Mycolicibacterium smegmatis]MDF1897372.1 Gfo/Idh/MocA family oxidoreductase [Mycolicibacterium smegmatis]MDF1904185.1 Gfo/Idh/MocA family oxidoreductase [Mycolicibacterium smegmatis]MDF1916938.1 Gfo/Idh/MocA family oxidoreductase [Mycolicibacterium smegmatis]MDF1922312.1 Gfo/Idh/MocA family oxidoreductase [Mycolicibacterium smegmatis]